MGADPSRVTEPGTGRGHEALVEHRDVDRDLRPGLMPDAEEAFRRPALRERRVTLEEEFIASPGLAGGEGGPRVDGRRELEGAFPSLDATVQASCLVAMVVVDPAQPVRQPVE